MITFILALLPSFIHVFIRRVMGAKIGKNSQIRFGTLLKTNELTIGESTVIGPFSYIYAKKINIGSNCQIKPFSVTKANEIKFANYVHIAPISFIAGPLIKGANITIGNHSRIFPFCWLEPGEGITLGNHVGVGGHTLIFTHGVWSNFIKGGPVSFGPVIIKDNVWLPWRVFILPNVVIEENTVVAANSVVSTSTLANSLVAGSPAKVIKRDFIKEPSEHDKIKKLHHIILEFGKYEQRIDDSFKFYKEGGVLEFGNKISINSVDGLEAGDLLIFIEKEFKEDEITQLCKKEISVFDVENLEIHIASNRNYINSFVSFIRRYGLRTNINYRG